MSPHLCIRCQQVTYPERWCNCDPREQIWDFFEAECVYLMPDQDDAPDL